MTIEMKYQYFSKWRNEWCDFKKEPTIGELNSLKKYFYQIRKIEVKNES